MQTIARFFVILGLAIWLGLRTVVYVSVTVAVALWLLTKGVSIVLSTAIAASLFIVLVSVVSFGLLWLLYRAEQRRIQREEQLLAVRQYAPMRSLGEPAYL